jgi:hypothetical protein
MGAARSAMARSAGRYQASPATLLRDMLDAWAEVLGQKLFECGCCRFPAVSEYRKQAVSASK